MPIVMIQIDATNTTGPGVAAAVTSLDTVSKALDKMATAGVAAKAGITDIGAKAASEAPGVVTLADAAKGLNSSLRGTASAVGQWDAAMQKLGASSGATRGFDALVAGAKAADDALGASMLVLDAYIAKLGELDAAALLTGRTLGGMRGMGSLGGLGGGGGAGGGYYGTSMASFGGTSLYGNGALQANAGGMGFRAGAGILGGVPMPLLIAGVIAAVGGVKAVTTANDYNQSIANIVSQSTQNAATVGPLQQAVLALAGGQNRFTPQQMVTGLYPIASSPIFNTADKQQAALKVVSDQAQGAGPSAIKPLAQADVAAVSAFGFAANKMGYVADVIAKGVNIGLAESQPFAMGVGTFSQAALAADPNKNRAFEQSIGAFAQQTNLSPRFRFDAQGENSFLLNVNKGLTKAGAQVADSLNITNLFGPGAIGKAGGLQAWFQQFEAATAGPHQQNYEQNLGLRQNALLFLRGFTGGNYASGQIAMSATQNAGGTVQKGAGIADTGPQAQWDQIQSRFQKDVINLGTLLSDHLTPALKNLATVELNMADTLGVGLDKLGRILSTLPHIPGLPGLPDIPGITSSGAVMGHLVPTTSPGATASPPNALLTGIMGAVLAQPGVRAAINNADQFLSNAGGGRSGGHRLRGGGMVPDLTGLGMGIGGAMDVVIRTSSQAATDALLASRGTPNSSLNQAVRNDRGALSNLEKSGTATSAQLHQALAKLAAALDHSTYSAGQKANILGKETANVAAYDRNLQAQGFQEMANAAMDNLTAAQQMGATPHALKAIFDQFIADERNVVLLSTKPGLARDKLLGGLSKQQQVGHYQYDVMDVSRGLKDRQDQAAIDKLNGNMGAYTADLKAIYAYQSANAQKFGMNGKDLALAFATMQHDIGAGQPKSNIHPFFQANQGVGGLMAGINSTAVRVGGAVDPATSAIRELMKENQRLQHENTNLLQEIANNTRRPGSAANPPTSAYGQRSGRT